MENELNTSTPIFITKTNNKLGIKVNDHITQLINLYVYKNMTSKINMNKDTHESILTVLLNVNTITVIPNIGVNIYT